MQVIIKSFLALIIFSSDFCFSQTENASLIPQNTTQLICVQTDSITATAGKLFLYERNNNKNIWVQVGDEIPVVLGRNGLGWGKGLNPVDSSKLPMKTEGDGRSPAGIFKLGPAFGYAPPEKMKGLKIPYIHVTQMTECIDDSESEYYNQIVRRNEIDKPDWKSSEKMYYAKIYYEQGVVVEQNSNPAVKGAGSCIFLHNWMHPDETSSGCTEMDPVNMKKIIYRLDSSQNPVFVQLTRQLFKEYKKIWGLPE